MVARGENEVESLPKGEHIFSFTISVPTTTATYERCSFGRVFHKLIGRAEGLGSFGNDNARGYAGLRRVVRSHGLHMIVTAIEEGVLRGVESVSFPTAAFITSSLP